MTRRRPAALALLAAVVLLLGACSEEALINTAKGTLKGWCRQSRDHCTVNGEER